MADTPEPLDPGTQALVDASRELRSRLNEGREIRRMDWWSAAFMDALAAFDPPEPEVPIEPEPEPEPEVSNG